MRHLMRPAVLVPVLLAASPAAAQVTSPGPVYYNSTPIPAPGQVMVQPPMVSPDPPYVAGPPPATMQGPGVPTAGPRVWQNGRWMALPPHGPNHGGQAGPDRWGGMIDGRWHAGARAPGGWRGYHRLGRGNRLPGYWMAGSFRVPDYLSFGLSAPPRGYFWVRYYDDAVLVDAGGNVWDSVGGIAWAGAGASAGGSWSNSYSYSNATVGAGYRQPITPVDPNEYYDEQYPGGYAPPAAVAPPAVQYRGYDNGYYGSGSYQSGAYYYGAPTGTTVTIITTPVTTTTTVIEEEVIEQSVATTSYVRSTPRRVVRKAPVRKHRPKPRVQCCVCIVCR